MATERSPPDTLVFVTAASSCTGRAQSSLPNPASKHVTGVSYILGYATLAAEGGAPGLGPGEQMRHTPWKDNSENISKKKKASRVILPPSTDNVCP